MPKELKHSERPSRRRDRQKAPAAEMNIADVEEPIPEKPAYAPEGIDVGGDDPTKKLKIIRGVPGAGKTTLAKKILSGTGEESCEADNFFVKDGKFCYNPKELRNAHQQCRAECLAKMKAGTPLVVVSNTSVRLWEMYYYVLLAEKFEYDVEFIDVVAINASGRNLDSLDLEERCRQNGHHVPHQAIGGMLHSWQPTFHKHVREGLVVDTKKMIQVILSTKEEFMKISGLSRIPDDLAF